MLTSGCALRKRLTLGMMKPLSELLLASSDMPAQAGREAAHFAMHALDAEQQLAHVHQQRFAGRRQLHAARAAHEQRRAQRVLQFFKR